MKRTDRSAHLLAGFLASAGAAHFANPRIWYPLVPRALPGNPRTWIHLSGAAELAVAASVAHPRTRRVGGVAAAVLFTAVLPGNMRMARDWRTKPAPLRAAAYARVPLQLPLILWACGVSRAAARSRAESAD